jgi:hypothetical protein
MEAGKKGILKGSKQKVLTFKEILKTLKAIKKTKCPDPEVQVADVFARLALAMKTSHLKQRKPLYRRAPEHSDELRASLRSDGHHSLTMSPPREAALQHRPILRIVTQASLQSANNFD